MAKRRREPTYFRYECSITGERYKLTKKVDNTDELVSVDAYYQLNPDEDDRPAVVKKELGVEDQES